MSFFNFKMENIMNILQKVRTPSNRPDKTNQASVYFAGAFCILAVDYE